MRPTEQGASGLALEARDVLQSFEIWPHRSLGPRGRAALIGAVGLGAMLTVARFPAAAALPLTIGAAITVGALSLALWCNNRAARRGELVEIGPDVVRVVRIGARGPEDTHEFSTGWVRVAISHDRQVAHRVTLTESGRSFSIGDFLSPDERRSLAANLNTSLAAARTSIRPT